MSGLGFVTGGVGIAISVTSTSQKLRGLCATRRRRSSSRRARVPHRHGHREGRAGCVLRQPNLTPTDKAVIVVVLKTLGNVGGREIYVATAAQANSIEMAFYYRRQSELIAKYNEKVAPVRGFVRAGRAPMIDTGRGTVSMLPVDYLYWSAPLEGLAGGGRGEMWITGRASSIATSQLAALGWTWCRRPAADWANKPRLFLDADAGAVGVIAGSEAQLVMRPDIAPARPVDAVADDHAPRPGGRSEIAIGRRTLVDIDIGLVPLGGCAGRMPQAWRKRPSTSARPCQS